MIGLINRILPPSIAFLPRTQARKPVVENAPAGASRGFIEEKIS
jgi:hypothetical protein